MMWEIARPKEHRGQRGTDVAGVSSGNGPKNSSEMISPRTGLLSIAIERRGARYGRQIINLTPAALKTPRR